MGAHPLYASVCVGYVGLVAHSQNIGIGIGYRYLRDVGADFESATHGLSEHA